MKKRKLQKCNFLFSAERETFEPITLTAYATISFISKISNM